jgi:hypothetical protein
MKTTVAALAAFATLLLAGGGGAESYRTAVGATPAKTEQFLVQRRISFDTPGGITVGPTLAAACRGEGPAEGYGSRATYYRFICAARVRNAKRLAVVRIVLPRQAVGPVDYAFLGWR